MTVSFYYLKVLFGGIALFCVLQYKTPMENIGLQDSLLSRFDVLFVLLDEMQPERDGSIAEHVLRIHRYRPADQHDGQVLPFGGGVDALTTEQLNQVSHHNSQNKKTGTSQVGAIS